MLPLLQIIPQHFQPSGRDAESAAAGLYLFPHFFKRKPPDLIQFGGLQCQCGNIHGLVIHINPRHLIIPEQDVS